MFLGGGRGFSHILMTLTDIMSVFYFTITLFSLLIPCFEQLEMPTVSELCVELYREFTLFYNNYYFVILGRGAVRKRMLGVKRM